MSEVTNRFSVADTQLVVVSVGAAERVRALDLGVRDVLGDVVARAGQARNGEHDPAQAA